MGDLSVELTKMSSEPLENRLESEKEELLLAGQERSRGWICTSTMARQISLSLTAALLVLSHWGEPAGPGYLALHITLWETITALILSVDLLGVNKEFVNCNRSKS